VDAVAEKYRAFWADKVSPLHSQNSEEFRHLVARELRALFSDHYPKSVLEIGCGNGYFFDFLNFSPRSYRGVDFAPKLLASFRSSHPDLALIEAEGSSYVDDATYDLILSHGVIQHFSLEMLDCHFKNARAMMHKNSLLVCAAVPWREFRSRYDLGTLADRGRVSPARWVKSQISRLFGRDMMGHWYRIEEIIALAQKYSFGVRFDSSDVHPYRFHAVLWPEAPSQEL
jgi:cyclopropane fatty-acyl-phospholipid synthase-like methyltransferase